jgi:GntR family transcriptional regulator
MLRSLEVDPRDSVPLWRQIEEGIRRLVASGALAHGGVVPSVRDLARDLRVNPATVVRAYQRLTDEGLLSVRRGEGTFVAEHPPGISASERSRSLLDGAVRYASLAVTIGSSRPEAVEALEAAFTKLEGERKVRRRP